VGFKKGGRNEGKGETPMHSSIWGKLNFLSKFMFSDIIELGRRLKG